MKRSNGLLAGMISLFLLPCLSFCAHGAALEMNGDVAVTGTLSATGFSGSGAGLTNVPGSAITGLSISVTQISDGAVTPAKIGFLGKVAIVAASGGDYTNPATAMEEYASWCGTPTESNPCLLKIMPGVYDVGTSPVVMQPYIDIEGSGEKTSVITGTVGSSASPPADGLVNGANNCEIRFLTVKNTGGGNYVAGFLNSGDSPRMTHMTATATGGTNNYGICNTSTSSPVMENVTVTASGGTSSFGVYNSSSSPTMGYVKATTTGAATNYAIYNTSSSPVMCNVTATASAGTGNNGVYNYHSSPVMNSVNATASGGTYCNGVYNHEASSPPMNNVIASASGGTDRNYGVFNYSSSPAMSNVTATASGGPDNRGVYNYGHAPTMSDVTAIASGGTDSYGVYNYYTSPTMTCVTATASGATNNYGLYNTASSGAHTMKIDRSTFSGATNSIRNDSEFTLWIGATNLTGGDANASGTYHCIGVYDGDDYTALNASCQ